MSRVARYGLDYCSIDNSQPVTRNIHISVLVCINLLSLFPFAYFRSPATIQTGFSALKRCPQGMRRLRLI